MLAATVPEWLEGNVAIGSMIVLLVVAIAVVRLVHKASSRLLLLGLLIAAAAAIVLQRDELERCGSTCRCELFSLDVKVPFCSTSFPGD